MLATQQWPIQHWVLCSTIQQGSSETAQPISTTISVSPPPPLWCLSTARIPLFSLFLWSTQLSPSLAYEFLTTRVVEQRKITAIFGAWVWLPMTVTTRLGVESKGRTRPAAYNHWVLWSKARVVSRDAGKVSLISILVKIQLSAAAIFPFSFLFCFSFYLV